VAGVLKAGTDVDCTSFVGQHAQSALDKKLIDETLIDQRLANLFKVRMRLGHFDAPGPLHQFPMSDVCSQYAIDLSNDGPIQSSALLKNLDSALPLGTGKQTIAVIGPNADLSKSDVSYYGPHTPCGAKYNTMIDALQQHSSATVVSALGVPSVLSDNTTGIAAAVEMAKSADIVVLAVGTDLSWAHEEHDADSIKFTDVPPPPPPALIAHGIVCFLRWCGALTPLCCLV